MVGLPFNTLQVSNWWIYTLLCGWRLFELASDPETALPDPQRPPQRHQTLEVAYLEARAR
jgi:hypothetical protein